MANNEAGYYTVIIGGEPHALKYEFNALAEIENVLDISLSDGHTLSFWRRISSQRALLWSGLLHADLRYLRTGKPSQSPQEIAGKFTSIEEWQAAIATAEEAFLSAFGDAEEEPPSESAAEGEEVEGQPKNPQEAGAGTGKRSRKRPTAS